MATLPPPLPAEDATQAGLGGAIQTPQEQPAAPATEPPEPHETFARHIVTALGGGSDPMGWARSVIGGGLTAAANVGKVPEGAGWLAGAARGAQGVTDLRRQQMLDQQHTAQVQQEMQLKHKRLMREQSKNYRFTCRMQPPQRAIDCANGG